MMKCPRSPEPRFSGQVAAVLGLALFPVLWVFVVTVMVEPRPFWAYLYDPETIHFYDSIRLRLGQPPENVDSPATPLHLLGALLVWVLDASVADLDAFRKVGYTCAFLATVAVAGYAARRWHCAGLGLPALLAGGAWYWTSPHALESVPVWAPELWYLPAGLLGSIALERFWRDPTAPRSWLLGMFVLGGLLALKITFLPWIVAWLGVYLLFRDREGDRVPAWAAAALLLVGSLAAFLLWTAPAASRWETMLARHGQLLANTGEYGSGPPGFESMATLLERATTAILSAKRWYLLLAVATVLVWVEWRKNASLAGAAKDPIRRQWAWALLSLGISLLSLFRSENARYQLPGHLAMVPAVASAVGALGRRNPRGAWGVALAIWASAFLQAHWTISNHRMRIQQAASERIVLETSVQELLSRDPQRAVLLGFRVPLPALALRIAAADPQFLREVERLYPRQGHVDWTGQIHPPEGFPSWSCLVMSRSEWQRLQPALPDLVESGTWRGYVWLRPAAELVPPTGFEPVLPP